MSTKGLRLICVALLALGTALVGNSLAIPCNGKQINPGKYCKDPYEPCTWMLTETYCNSHLGDLPWFVNPGCATTMLDSYCAADLQYQECNKIYSCFWDAENQRCNYNIQQSSTATTHYDYDDTCEK